jgi:hypothetical protein
MPALAIRTSWRLECNLKAFLDDCSLYWLVKIEALAHAAGCLKDFIG